MNRWRQKRWRVAASEPQAEAAIAGALSCTPLMARLLANRGLIDPAEAGSFLSPSFEQLSDPFMLPDAEAAAERVKTALNTRERICVHGDYDADGVTSAALWTRFLERLGADVQVHVPHRHRDGYDLRSKFVAQAKADGVKLIITTDCGIQRVDEVEEAREAGIDVIVTDHHEPGCDLPRAVAVVNPHRKDSRYPFPDLAGVGVAFRTAEAVVRHLGMPIESFRRAYVDLAAIGTVTDLMPLVGENRVIVQQGLGYLRGTRKLGLRALLESAGLERKPLSAYHIGFGIGPRLNAVGRVDDSRIALDLLLSRDPAECASLVARLEQANLNRREEEARILTEAMEQLGGRDLTDTACLVLSGAGWHSGVIGIVAAKLVERCGRPTVLIALDEETGIGRGSARSIQPFDIFDAISACSSRLIEFGGHSHAAGLSIEGAEVEAFATELNEIASLRLTEEDFLPVLEADAEVDPAELDVATLQEIARLEPFGLQNPEPLLVSRSVQLSDVRRIGKEQQHLKLNLRMDDGRVVDAVMWGVGDLADHLHAGDRLDLCYRPRLNVFNGRTSVQFMVEDLRPSGLDW